MALRVQVEERAVSLAKRFDHAELSDLHILKVLLDYVDSSNYPKVVEMVDAKLSKIRGTGANALTISEPAKLLLGRVQDEAPEQLIREIFTDNFSDVDFDEIAPLENGHEAKVGNEAGQEETLDEILSILDGLVGLGNVKSQINKLVNVHKTNTLRANENLPMIPIGLHLVFTGSPGTGKTTVARIIAKAYKSIGLLPEGQLVEVDRADLVAGYVGQTALKVQEAMERAKGGVLFIDEAYALSEDSGAGFGDEAISTIVKGMEDNRGNMAIIVAGYKEPMESFIKSNQGLKSRFQNVIAFEDYTTPELSSIFKKLCEEFQVKSPSAVDDAVENYLDKVKPTGDLGNARFVRNLFEAMYLNLSNRAAQDGKIELREVVEFNIADVPTPEVKKQTFGFT
jgi:SpoVK/Ycf46/Vps4 family AAA+-type ATPase